MKLKEIKKLIQESGLMQKHIAEKIDVSPEHLNRVLKGRSPLTGQLAGKLQIFLNR